MRKLFSKNDSIYEVVSVPQVGVKQPSETSIHMLSDIQYFLELRLPYDYNPHIQTFGIGPLQLRFVCDKPLDIETFGSFSSKMPGALQCFLSDKAAVTSSVSKDCEYQIHSRSLRITIKEEDILAILEADPVKYGKTGQRLPLYLSIVTPVNDVDVRLLCNLIGAAPKEKVLKKPDKKIKTKQQVMTMIDDCNGDIVD